MAIASNNGRDIVIKISGNNQLGPALTQAERQLGSFRDRIGKMNADLLRGLGGGIGGKFGGGVGQLLGGGLAGGGAFAAGMFGVDLLSRGFEKLAPVAEHAFERIRLSMAGIDSQTMRFKQSIDEAAAAYEKLRQQNQKQVSNAATSFNKSVQPVLGPFTRGVPDLTDQQVEAFDQQRGALEKQRMDAIQRFQGLAFGIDNKGRRGKEAFVERGINELIIGGKSTAFMRPELGAQFDRELSKANSDIQAAENAMTKLDSTIEKIQNLRQKQRNLGFGISQGVRGVASFLGGGVAGGMGAVQGAIGGPLANAQQLFSNFQTQLQIEQSIQTPAQALRERFNELVRMRGEGVIGGDLFSRATAHLAERARGMLPDMSFGRVPGLAAVESRTLTRGNMPDNEERQQNRQQTELLRDLKKLLQDISKNTTQVTVLRAR